MILADCPMICHVQWHYYCNFISLILYFKSYFFSIFFFLNNQGNRTNYNRIKATEETTPYAQEIEETIPSSEIEGSMSSSFHPNNYHLPSQTTDTTSLTSAQASEYEDAESGAFLEAFYVLALN